MSAGLLHQDYFKQFLFCSSHLLLSLLCVSVSPQSVAHQWFSVWFGQSKKRKGAVVGCWWCLLSAEKELSLVTSPFGGSWPRRHVGSAIHVLAPWRWVEIAGGKEKRKLQSIEIFVFSKYLVPTMRNYHRRWPRILQVLSVFLLRPAVWISLQPVEEPDTICCCHHYFPAD